ncbi:hypothetical protein BC940DRAFT_286831 [Gongronella butleri]|nr:hypothetical protein BC940DRAFT_286831 [Gongronella butleri]
MANSMSRTHPITRALRTAPMLALDCLRTSLPPFAARCAEPWPTSNACKCRTFRFSFFILPSKYNQIKQTGRAGSSC